MPAKTRSEAAQRPQEAPEAASPNGHIPEPPEERTAALEAVREFEHDTGDSPLSVPPVAAEWDADQRNDHPLTVWEAIAEVTRQVEAIAKTRTATSGGSYKFRGIDDVLAALHPLLGDVGLVIMPGVVRESRWETRATAQGGTLNVARLLVQYRLIGPDGTETYGEAWGEAGDSGDKATQKAHSQSYKSFTLQLFSIPTEQSAADEPDATNPAARPFTAEEVQRATNAANAAEAAESVEALAGVRRRALHLLPVPVPLEDGSVAPLSVLFDQRLASLDRAGEPA
jgi:hypothetical protein